ncbi:AEC family transporter [Martelella soudanensis]|uniref:AEC family transporter n=1 Tax=unclassified Martelella TaxID=2629616 RepID=UPI0015DEB5AC|nr:MULTISPECIES: AEC family transporter [unclassified Martelella]
MVTQAILLALVPVFFVLLLGYGAGRLKIVDNHHIEGLNVLVMTFAVPAALFVATASAPRAELLEQSWLFAILSGVMLIVLAGWYFCARRFLGMSPPDAALQGLTVAFPNLAGVGLPISTTLLGATGTVQLAIAIAAGSIIISPLSLIVVELNQPGRDGATISPTGKIAGALGRALRKPVVLAPALGIIVSISGLKLGPVIDASFALMGQAGAGVALFLTGLVLSSQPFRLDWKIAGATVASNVVRPLLTAAIVFVLPVSTEVAKVSILLASVPSGFFGILFAISYRRDSAAIGSMVIASMVLSAMTMAIAIAVLFP